MALTWNGYKKDGFITFHIQFEYEIQLHEYFYIFKVKNNTDFSIKKRYDKVITKEDKKIIINYFGKLLMEQIKKELKSSN